MLCVTSKSCHSGGLFFPFPAWLPQIWETNCTKNAWGCQSPLSRRQGHWREAAVWMMNVTLCVSILASASFQRHLLYRLSLGNLKKLCWAEDTLDRGSSCSVAAFSSEAHDPLEGHSLQTEVSISSRVAKGLESSGTCNNYFISRILSLVNYRSGNKCMKADIFFPHSK